MSSGVTQNMVSVSRWTELQPGDVLYLKGSDGFDTTCTAWQFEFHIHDCCQFVRADNPHGPSFLVPSDFVQTILLDSDDLVERPAK